MRYFRCIVCDFIYNPKENDSENYQKKSISFSELPNSWKCPECGSSKKFFIQMNIDKKS